jgi:hypothetical protein
MMPLLSALTCGWLPVDMVLSAARALMAGANNIIPRRIGSNAFFMVNV